jgi:hypothetical protein
MSLDASKAPARMRRRRRQLGNSRWTVIVYPPSRRPLRSRAQPITCPHIRICRSERFWRSGVADTTTPQGRIATAGSCFAQHIARNFRARASAVVSGRSSFLSNLPAALEPLHHSAPLFSSPEPPLKPQPDPWHINVEFGRLRLLDIADCLGFSHPGEIVPSRESALRPADN